jgi:hypothetical protein
VRRSSASNIPATTIANRKAILWSKTACKTETDVCIAPVNGTLALVVLLRFGFRL